MKVIRNRRLALSVLLVIACTALGAVWGIGAFASGPSADTAEPSTRATDSAAPASSDDSAMATPPAAAEDAAPIWLQEQAGLILHGFIDGPSEAETVSSVSWVRTTWGQYQAAVGGGGSTTNEHPAYVVVAHGRFKSELAVGDESIKAETLVMTFDEATQKISTVDVLYESEGIAVDMLGEMASLQLPDPAE